MPSERRCSVLVEPCGVSADKGALLGAATRDGGVDG